MRPVIHAIAFAFLTLHSVASAQSPDLSEPAQNLATKIAEHLAGAGGTPDVAVFPFSNAEGNVTPEMANLPVFVQGEILHWLTEKSDGKFFVLNKAALARRIKDREISPTNINPSDRRLTAATLKKAGIKFAVLGSFDGVLPSELENWADVKINAAVFDDEGRTYQLTGQLDTYGVKEHMASSNGVPRFERNRRLKVEILVSGQTLPMQQCRNPDSPFCGNLFLEIPQTYLGREYQIRITNRGKPGVDTLQPMNRDGLYSGMEYKSSYDSDRLIGVAVYVDGVSTLFEKNSDGDFEPVIREPSNLSKWLLTPPGKILRVGGAAERWDNGGTRINDGQLVGTRGLGNSQLLLKGFQVSNETAQAFVFGDSSQSLAEMIGITKEIGVLSVYVFPEQVPEEESLVTKFVAGPDGTLRPMHSVGTLAGRPLPSDVRGFQVSLVDTARQVWKIFYRAEGEPSPVSQSDLAPFVQ
jgi:hypothetical protein